MRIFTIIRQSLDAEENVQVVDGAVQLGGSKLVLDAMDEYGVEEALRFRENGTGVEIVAIAVGPTRLAEALRSTLAMGVDRAIHIETDIALNPLGLSKVISELANEEQADIIFTGGQQADWDSQALGASVAERLSWPQITWTTNLALTGQTLSGTHDIDDGTESFIVDLPVVITTQQGLNEPRYPTLPGIMKAKKKIIRKDDIGRFNITHNLVCKRSETQIRSRLNKILDGKDAPTAAGQLVHLLRHEARVIA